MRYVPLLLSLMFFGCGFSSRYATPDAEYDVLPPRIADVDEQAGGVFPGCGTPLLVVASEPVGHCYGGVAVAGEVGREVLRLTLTNVGDAPFDVEQIPITFLLGEEGDAGEIENVRFDGHPASLNGIPNGREYIADITFAEPIRLEAGASETIVARVDVRTVALGARSGAWVSAVIEPVIETPLFTRTSIVAYGGEGACRTRLRDVDIVYENPNWLGILIGAQYVIRYARLSIELAPDTPSGLRSPALNQVVAHFIMRNDAGPSAGDITITDLRGGFATTIALEGGSVMAFYRDSTDARNEVLRVGYHPGPHGWEAGSFTETQAFTVVAGSSRHLYVAVDTDDAGANRTLTFTLDSVSWDDGSGGRGIYREVCGLPLSAPTQSY